MTTTTAPAGRRTLHFSSMADLASDVRDLGSDPTSSGNWSAAENLQHVAKLIGFSLDGFPPMKMPLMLRLLGPRMKGRFLSKGFPTGVKLKGDTLIFAPDDGVTWDQACDLFDGYAKRIESGDRMTHRSPLFGDMSHDDWVRVHCRHAELHLSFVHPDD